MAMKCALCKKGIQVGRSHKHHPGVAGGRWKKRAPKTRKVFKPNLHVAHIVINGGRKKVRLCTKCLRTARLDSAKRAIKTVVSPVSQPEPLIVSV